MTTTFELDDRSQALVDFFDADPITLLDDLVQKFTNEGHEDLAGKIHDVLLELDSREHPTGPEYNGWKNYGTWNVALWIDNDQGLYALAIEYAKQTEDPTYRGFVEYAGLDLELTPDRVRYLHVTHDYDGLDEFIAEFDEKE